MALPDGRSRTDPDADIRLTPTSYIILGLLQQAGEVTPYDLKQLAGGTLANIWTIQHAQLYSEPERLARAGYLSEKREQHGRRRKHYALTERGRAALADWLATPTSAFMELRDLGLLKLFFGGASPELARQQVDTHRRKLAEYEALYADCGGGPPGLRQVLEAGMGHEREFIRFWSQLAEQG